MSFDIFFNRYVSLNFEKKNCMLTNKDSSLYCNKLLLRKKLGKLKLCRIRIALK